MPDIDRAIRDGLDGWDRDDLARLASLLAAEAGLVWYEPGAWDCHGSATLQRLLRRCQTEGTGGPYRVHTPRTNKAAPWPQRRCTDPPRQPTLAERRNSPLVEIQESFHRENQANETADPQPRNPTDTRDRRNQ